MRQATRTQWIKCTIAILLYLAFLIWVRSWWGLIVVPFIFDIYITKKIPWSFWKKSKNPTVRNVMSWVDAIVFAVHVFQYAFRQCDGSAAGCIQFMDMMSLAHGDVITCLLYTSPSPRDA